MAIKTLDFNSNNNSIHVVEQFEKSFGSPSSEWLQNISDGIFKKEMVQEKCVGG